MLLGVRNPRSPLKESSGMACITAQADLIILSSPLDSQESYWSHYTAGSLSTQSSQEECPDMAGVGEGTVDYSSHHRVLELASCVQLSEDRRYT